MAKYEVQVDGSTYEVEGPDDREPTEAEVRRLLGNSTDSASAMTPAAQPLSQSEQSSGFLGHFGPTAMLKGVFGKAGELTDGSKYNGLLDNPIVRNFPLLVVPGTSFNDLSSTKSALDKSVNEIGNGNVGTGLLDATKAYLPGIAGPIEAGQDVAAGRPGATGAVTGELANLALMGLGKAAPKIAEPIGEWADRSATRSMVEGLNPNKRYLATAEKIAPELARQGVWGSVPSLEEAASTGLDKAGPALDEAWQQGGMRDLPVSGIKQALQQHIQSLSPVGAEPEPLSVSKAAAAQNLIDYLDRVAPEGNVSAEQARSLRQLWDDPVARKSAYLPGADPNLTANVEAARTGANALRSTIADIVPEAVEPNKQFKLYSDLQDVLDHRKAGSKGVAATALGTIAGSSLGPWGALKGAAVAKMLHAAMNSPAWNTFSAVQKAKLARALLGATEGAGAGRGIVAPDSPAQLPGNTYEGATGPVIEPNIAPDLETSAYDTYGGPPEAPFDLPSAAQPTLQTSFGKSSSFQLPLESQALPPSILQEALINELLQQLKHR